MYIFVQSDCCCFTVMAYFVENSSTAYSRIFFLSQFTVRTIVEISVTRADATDDFKPIMEFSTLDDFFHNSKWNYSLWLM